MIRTYAQVAAVLLIALAVAGLLGLSWTVASVFYHAGVGALYAYVGFVQRDAESARLMIGGLGVLLLLVKGVTIVAPLLWGGSALHGPIEVTCLVVGISSILAAKYL